MYSLETQASLVVPGELNSLLLRTERRVQITSFHELSYEQRVLRRDADTNEAHNVLSMHLFEDCHLQCHCLSVRLLIATKHSMTMCSATG